MALSKQFYHFNPKNIISIQFPDYFRIFYTSVEMTSRPRGSLIIETAFQPRRKLLPVVAAPSTSDWSTIGQYTTTASSDKSSVRVINQDWSEEDADGYDPVEEYDDER